MTIEEAIRTFARKEVKIQVRLCTVTSVNETQGSCTVKTDEGVELFDVRLKSVITDVNEGIVIIPKVGSFVLVGLIQNIDVMTFVCSYSEVSSIKFKCSDSGVIQLNGDSYEMVKAQELKGELAKNNQLLESLLSVINGVGIPEAGGGAVSSFQAALKVAITGKSLGDFSSINNNKVKHG